MRRRSLSSLVTGILSSNLLFSIPAYAVSPVQEPPGWSGFIALSAAYTDVESNTVAGNDLIDGGKKTIRSIYDDPGSSSLTHLLPGGEVKYTFENRHQVFLGGSLEDRLTLDMATQLGWRKQFDTVGILQAGFLFSGIPTEVWEDPYLAGKPRQQTDRDSTGARIEWGQILGSAFEVVLQYRDIEIDKELSGTDPALGCDPGCQALLDRNGEQYAARLSYTFKMEGGHIFRPQIGFSNEDRDGAAAARDRYSLQLTYSYIQPGWIIVANALYGESQYDRRNPLYGVRADADNMALDLTVLYRLPVESRRWQLTAGGFWGESDSDIDFHDNRLTQVFVGLIYHFGKQ